MYRGKQALQGKIRFVDLLDTLFPIHETQFYFSLFGKRGFHEYQIVVPADSIYDYLDAVRDYLNSHSIAVTLASAKLFCGSQDLLRFTGEGVCFALNFPRTQESPAFLKFLDRLVIQLGIPNIIKIHVALISGRCCYPEAEQFRKQLRSFDPKRMFRSELSERPGL
jgi:decaprenylphospho-beta-D-ribofuranose 2-oxidase